jgi:predicted Zn-dependent protease
MLRVPRRRAPLEDCEELCVMNLLLRAVPFAALTLLAACETVQTTEAGAVGVTREQRVSTIVSSKEIEQQAAKEYSQVLAEAQKKGVLNRDPQQLARVRTISQRLIPQVAVFRKDAVQWKWETNVLTSKDVNAWCMPGGKIAVYTGLIERLNITDDELAAVMGHEIAHALREHARERIANQMTSSAVSTVGSLALEIFTGVRVDPSLAGSAVGAVLVLPNSRQNEQEADVIGVELMARAGYDPRASLSLWQKMGQISGGGGTPEFLSTHPSGETRLRDLQGYVDKVMPLYQAAKR